MPEVQCPWNTQGHFISMYDKIHYKLKKKKKERKKKETVFSSFPTSKQKRNSHPNWDHITTGRMRKMSNSFGPSLLHRWKGEHGKMVIFQVTPLATQIQTVPVSECSQVFHAYAGCIPVLLSYKRKVARALLWWHILWQIFTNMIFVLAFQLKGARDQCTSFPYQCPKCIIPGVLPYWLNACWINDWMKHSD